jgi:hypothetical protein
MLSGKQIPQTLTARLIVCSIFVPLVMIASISSPAGAFALPDLMAMLAKVDHSDGAFEETRHLAVLDAPIVRRGTLLYTRPDRLEMRVVTPSPETIAITGDRIYLRSREGNREWEVSAQPVVLAWIEAIRATLAGDGPSLTRLFRIEVNGDQNSWEMRLEPVDPRVSKALSWVYVRGKNAAITSVEVRDAQGDRISIAIKPGERFPP